MASRFPGFTAGSFAFFTELARNNNKAWFDQNRGRYEQYVQGAFRGLLESLGPFLLRVNPNLERPRGKPTGISLASIVTSASAKTRAPTRRTTTCTSSTVTVTAQQTGGFTWV
jgi:uncharacterized protein (DUF2461 family)